MQTVQSASSVDALKAGRAFGAMVFSFFGMVLLEVWDRRAGAGVMVFAGIALLLAAALIGFALAYPRLASGGPADPVGFLGAGLVLWTNALWALRDPAPRQA